NPGLDWAAPVAYLRSESGKLFSISPATESVPEERASDARVLVIQSPRLSGEQYGLLQQALLNAFSLDELRMIVRIELGENLDAIAGTGSLAAITGELISWAERTDRLADLVQGAITAREGN